MAMTPLVFDATAFYGDMVPVTAGDLPAYLTQINGRMVVAFIDGADETAVYTPATRMPTEYAGGTLTAHLCFFSAVAANAHVMEVYVEAVTDGDSTDLDAATSFDTVNTATITVPATAGFIDIAPITLTNKDSVAAADSVRFLVRRNAPSGSDTATGTMYLLWMAIIET